MKILLLAASLALVRAAPPTRIVSGSPITIEEAPHQLMMQYRGSFTCGATLIGPTWALTAAHCVDGRTAADITLLAGLTYQSTENTDSSVEEHTTKRIIMHAGFGGGVSPDDIALCELNTPVTMSAARQVIGYDGGSGTPNDGDDCAISGWGKTGGLQDTSDQLMGAYISVISNLDCGTMWGQVIHPGQVCLFDGEDGACSGDSGGPLTCPASPVSARIVSGATSWGTAMCRDNLYPSVYARVSYYADWIQANTGIAPA